MGNTNTEHSRKQRQQTAKARRAAIIAAGGKRLNTLLQAETARKLMFLREWYGTAHGAATETDVITKLINEACDEILIQDSAGEKTIAEANALAEAQAISVQPDIAVINAQLSQLLMIRRKAIAAI